MVFTLFDKFDTYWPKLGVATLHALFGTGSLPPPLKSLAIGPSYLRIWVLGIEFPEIVKVVPPPLIKYHRLLAKLRGLVYQNTVCRTNH